MSSRRHWIALVIAGGVWNACSVWGQDDSGFSGGAASSFGASGGSSSTTWGGTGTGAGASSSFGAGSTSSGTGSASSSLFDSGATAPTTSPFGSPFDSGTSPSTSTAAPSPFGSTPSNTAPPAYGAPAAASTFGTGPDFGSARPPEEPTPSFSIPSAYGQASQSFILGQGRLARPRFEYGASLQFGYDDNTLQTPTKTQSFPAITQEVIIPATPDRIEERTVVELVPEIQQGSGVIVLVPRERTERVVIKGKKERRETVVLQEAIPAQERIGSFFLRASANYDLTFASRRTVFTMDLRGNADYYFERPNDQTDLTGSIAVNYLYRFTPRLQFSASASASLLSQPDVRLINAPTQNVGDYYAISSRFNLSYQWTRRFSLVGSFSFNSILYSEKTRQTGNFAEAVFGLESRYRWSSRLTLLAEGRYANVWYDKNPSLDSDTIYLLLGAEYAFSNRTTATLRIGEALRQFENTSDLQGADDTSMTPYLESTLSYRYAPTGFLSWNTRFGFEEPPTAQSEVLGFRTGLSAIQAFSSRLRGNLGLTYVYRRTTDEISDLKFNEQTFDVNVGLEYAFSRHLSFNAAYVYTQTISNTEINDYYRNRIFIGAQYSF